jgi:putative flippase GtrA
MVFGDNFGYSTTFLVTCSFGVCVIVGYLLHCRFTFEVAARSAGFARYALAMTMNYPLTLALIWLLHSCAGFSMLVTAPLSTVGLTLYNFISSRWAVTYLGVGRTNKAAGQ